MNIKKRLETLEKKSGPAGPLLVVCSVTDETKEEAWAKTYGDQPVPENRQVLYVMADIGLKEGM